MAAISARYDMLVAGASLAGMTAASAVAREGGRVLVMEKSPQVGGSSLMSGGVVWTAKEVDLLIRGAAADETRTPVILTRVQNSQHLTSEGIEATIEHSEHFRPAKPVPTYRMAEA